MGPFQHNVGSLVEDRINEPKCYYYTAQYIAHMTGGARTAVYVLRADMFLTPSPHNCAGSACVQKLILNAGRIFGIFEC